MRHHHCVSFFLASLLLLAGCTYNPFTENKHLTGSAAGAALGAGFGATAAAVFHVPKTMIALAGLGGAGLGYYVTTLRFASGGVMQAGGTVFTVGEYATINIPSDKLFDANTSDLLPEANPILASAIEVLKRYPDNNIMISGNTSGFGLSAYEKQLSEARARQVAAYLWANGINTFTKDGMTMRKLVYTGYGDYFPIANNIHNSGIRANSRIQITAIPTKVQLSLDSRHKVFCNIGDSSDCCISKKTTACIDFNKVFPPEGLPEERCCKA